MDMCYERMPTICKTSYNNRQNHANEISAMASQPKNWHRKKGAENISQMISDIPMLTLAQLFDKATVAEYSAICANQEEILYWSKGIVYDKMLEHLFIVCKKRSEGTGLQGKTQKAIKIYNLFEKIGIDKIKYIKIYTTNAISELTNNKIQTIINYFSKNTNTDLPDGSIDNSSNKSLKTEVNIPAKSQVFDSEPSQENNQYSKQLPKTFSEAAALSNPTRDHVYFCNKILEEYPNFYKDGNSENVNYYRIADDTLCPLYKLDHDDDEDIE
ncbi:16476_t:CDS:2, partial [Gigaspora rosea]